MIAMLSLLTLLAGAAQAEKPAEKKEVKWVAKYKEALALAQKEGKPLVIDGSRTTCPNCQAMEANILPSAEISPILAAKFICLKIDIDNPGEAEKMMSQVKGNVLPFYAYVSPDGKFISGTSGYRGEKAFKADLEGVLKSDVLKVAPDAEKKLSKLVEQVAKDLEAKKVASAFKSAKEADAVRGFSDSKDKLKELAAQAVQIGMDRIQAAADLCKDSKFDDASTALASVLKDFKGTEVEAKANSANKAVDHLRTASKFLEKEDKASARKHCEAIVKECKDLPSFLELGEAKLKGIAP